MLLYFILNVRDWYARINLHKTSKSHNLSRTIQEGGQSTPFPKETFEWGEVAKLAPQIVQKGHYIVFEQRSLHVISIYYIINKICITPFFGWRPKSSDGDGAYVEGELGSLGEYFVYIKGKVFYLHVIYVRKSIIYILWHIVR